MRYVENYPNYKVSTTGEVWSCKYHKFLKFSFDRRGYARVKLYNESSKCTVLVHRLVGIAFIPNPSGKRTINHKDGVKSNNNVSNLEWATDSENAIHAFNTGLRKAPKQKSRKLSREEVLSVRKLYFENHEKQRDIAIKYGMNQRAIWAVIHKKTYKEII